jgi:hypothetical protein
LGQVLLIGRGNLTESLSRRHLARSLAESGAALDAVPNSAGDELGEQNTAASSQPPLFRFKLANHPSDLTHSSRDDRPPARPPPSQTSRSCTHVQHLDTKPEIDVMVFARQGRAPYYHYYYHYAPATTATGATKYQKKKSKENSRAPSSPPPS